MATQAELLAALGAADKAGDTQAAIAIAQAIHALPTDRTPPPAPATPALPGPPASALSSGQDTLQFGPLNTHIPLPASTADQLAGVGKAFHDVGQGIGQKLGLTSSQDVQNSRDTDRELMRSPNGVAGNVLGNAAIMAPAGMIPGVNGAVGTALAGGILGSLQPSTSLGEQANNTAIGAGAPAVIGGIGRGARAVAQSPAGNLVSSLLPGGTQRTARRIFQNAVGDQSTLAGQGATVGARAQLEDAANSGALADKYGIRPTTAQLAGNSGLAQLDRTLRNNGDVAPLFDQRDMDNRTAIVKILENISGTPESRDALSKLRQASAKAAYDPAVSNPVHSGVIPPDQSVPAFADELAAKERGLPNSDGTPSSNDPSAPAHGLNGVGVRLQNLVRRPAMQDALNNAGRQAANRGVPLDDTNLIQQLHYAKLHLDGKIGSADRTGDSTEMGGLLDTKRELSSIMDELSPDYKLAREQYQADSRPLNRAEVGEALRQKYLSGLADYGGTNAAPAAFASSLRAPASDQLAARATGFEGATLDNTLSPSDLESLRAAATQMGRQQFAQTAGRGVGSNTGQNLVNQRTLDDVGSLSSIAPEGAHAATIYAAVHHPAAIPLTLLGSGVRSGVKRELGNMALDPSAGRAALAPPEPGRVGQFIDQYLTRPIGPLEVPGVVKGATVDASQDAMSHADGGPVQDPQKLINLSRMSAQTSANEWEPDTHQIAMDQARSDRLSSPNHRLPVTKVAPTAAQTTLPVMSASNNLADGGQPEPRKSTFWDLVAQAIKEATGPSNPPAQQPAPDPGTQASGTVGRSFDNNIDQQVEAQGH